MTIIEETNELAEIFAGMRSAGIRYSILLPSLGQICGNKHPELLPYLSTSKSPMEMFGSLKGIL